MRVLVVALWVPALFLFAWWLAVYRLKLLMKLAGVVLLVLAGLMAVTPNWLADKLGRLAMRIAHWIVDEIEEHG